MSDDDFFTRLEKFKLQEQIAELEAKIAALEGEKYAEGWTIESSDPEEPRVPMQIYRDPENAWLDHGDQELFEKLGYRAVKVLIVKKGE